MIKQAMAALLALMATSGAVAQNNALGGLQCSGKPVTVRVSAIKPGQLATFKKAVADHQAWYASHQNGTRVALVRLSMRGGAGARYDDDTAMTIVTYDNKPQPAHDAGYDAFVKGYQASSTVKEEHRGCMG